MNIRNKQDKGGHMYASTAAKRNLKNFPLMNSHLLLEKTNVDVRS